MEAAHDAFVELGVRAPVEEIARRAGVGVATIYRRFPDRSRLAEAVFVERGRTYVAMIEEALADGNAASSFQTYMSRLFEVQGRDRALMDLLTVTLPSSKEVRAVRSLIYRRQRLLITRAQQAGGLRRDVTPEDVILLLLAHSGVVQALGAEVPEAPRRFAALALQSLVPSAAAPLPAAPSSASLLTALQRLPAVVVRRRAGGPDGRRRPPSG